jgi:hypothetical protein
MSDKWPRPGDRRGMTTTTAAMSDDPIELAERPDQEVQQADDEAVLELVASNSGLIHNVAILSLLAVVQVSWLVALGYAVIRFTP